MPPKEDKRWRDLVTGKIQARFEFLALTILLMRVTQSVKRDPSPQNIEKSVNEVYDFCQKNTSLLKKDLATIFA